MLYAIGIFTSFFLAIIILTKKGRSRADLILGIWMIVVSLHLISYYGYLTQQIFQYPEFLGLNIPLPFLHGVFLYWYVQALTKPSYFETKKWSIHLGLPLMIIGLYLPFFLLPGEEKIQVFKQEGRGYEWLMELTGHLLTVSGVVYVFITQRLLIEHKKRILDQFSNQERINLNWIRFLIYAMMVIWVCVIIIKNDDLIFSMASFFVIFLGYFGIKQVGIFTNNIRMEDTELTKFSVWTESQNEEHVGYKKYAKSGLDEEAALELQKKLNDLMEEEKLFKDPEINLTDLSKKLNVHPNYLSQAINDREGVNFYDYINRLRVDEFKKMVVQPESQSFTLIALAYECGFNSKSTFYKFFRKLTDMSPSEYYKKNAGK